MKYQNILFETQDNIAEIKLNRPKLLNSFNYEMADEFLDALKKCNKDIIVQQFVSAYLQWESMLVQSRCPHTRRIHADQHQQG